MLNRLSICYTGVGAVIVLSLYGCGQRSSSPQGRPGAQQRNQSVSIQTTTVQRASFQRQVDLSGTLVSPDQVRVSSEVAGKVTEVLIEIGQEVTAGQPLVRLDTTELNLALQRAESALRQTEAQLGIDASKPDQLPPEESVAAVRTAAAQRDDARAQLARAQELVAKGLLPKAELDTTQTRLKITEAAYQAALENIQALRASLQDRRANLDLARKKLNDAVIRAPVDGAIAERTVQRGEYIRENTPVLTIVKMNPLMLRTAVQEKHANLVHQNQAVEFHVEPYPDDVFTGKIAFISPAIDQATRTFAAEILVDNPARRLKPGFFAKGQVTVAHDQNVMAVPEETISNLAGVASVYIIQNGVAKQQTVQLGQQEGKFVEILNGLKGDEILAASNLNQLVSGVKVSDGDEESGHPGGGPIGDAGPGDENGTRRGGEGRRGAGRGNSQ
jgi:RND family efflux transporter MFP subunit